jgi:hypothetical protein
MRRRQQHISVDEEEEELALHAQLLLVQLSAVVGGITDSLYIPEQE